MAMFEGKDKPGEGESEAQTTEQRDENEAATWLPQEDGGADEPAPIHDEHALDEHGDGHDEHGNGGGAGQSSDQEDGDWSPAAGLSESSSDREHDTEPQGERSGSRVSVVDEQPPRPAPPEGASEDEYKWHTYKVYPSGR